MCQAPLYWECPHQVEHTLSNLRNMAAPSGTRAFEPPAPLPAPGSFAMPKNPEEEKKMMDLARRMLEKVTDFAERENNISEQEAAVLKEVFNAGNHGPA